MSEETNPVTPTVAVTPVEEDDAFTHAMHCLNCGMVRTGVYCPACGQRRVQRLVSVPIQYVFYLLQ